MGAKPPPVPPDSVAPRSRSQAGAPPAIPARPPPPPVPADATPNDDATPTGPGRIASTPPAPGPTAPPPVRVTPQPPTTKDTLTLSLDASQLRNEQVQAAVTYFQSHLETNEELDQITHDLVAELRAADQVKAEASPSAETRTSYDVEIALIRNLREHLEKVFSPKRTMFLHRLIADVQRRISKLFFHSELYARIAAESSDDVPRAAWPEQALFTVMKQHETLLQKALEEIPAEHDQVRLRARERLQSFIRQLSQDFLSRTTPELERLLTRYSELLSTFFTQDFRDGLGEFCWEVVRESRIAVNHRYDYKITADRFPAFRRTFDKKFIERLAFTLQEPMIRTAAEADDAFREATLRFVASPQIHSEICGAVADVIYDDLFNEGFLDLPNDWEECMRRSTLHTQHSGM